VELETLEERREVQDMAQAYKMIQGQEKSSNMLMVEERGKTQTN
jgi:hypothetical protein